jgi:isopenicillin N synthase-like dioxygenase
MQADAWQILTPDASDHDVRGLIKAAYMFFEQSSTLKSYASDPATLTGYRPIGIEYGRWPDRYDQMETFSISGAHLNTGPRFPLDSAVSERMYETCTDSFGALHRKAAEIVAQLFWHSARIEDVSPDWILRNTTNGSFLQVNSYAMSANEPRPAQDCHEDANLVTVGTADAPGLEIMQDDGEFVPAGNVDGAYVWMVGGALSALLGGKPAPCQHRVMAVEGVDRRISVQLFVSPAPNCLTNWPSAPGVAVQDVLARSNLSGLAFGLAEHTRMLP